MYATVLGVIIGLGLLSVDLMAGTVPSRRAVRVRSLEGLMSYADIPWLSARVKKWWAKRTLK
jgi:hypothetical protein